jgi:DHA2 family multidrug resistance protein-like MFS transporter
MFPLTAGSPAANEAFHHARPPAPALTGGDGLPDRVRPVAVGAVLGAMTLVVLDAGVTNLALPTIASALGVPSALAVLVVTAYQTGLIIALLPCAALGERFGYRRVFVSGIVLFIAASALCSSSPSLPWLAAARLLQGLGGAAVMALGVPLLRLSGPPDRLGAAIGWNAVAVALASSAGPGLGALILSHASWPWLYALNIPAGAAVLTAAAGLPRAPGAARPLDLLSMGLSAGMFAAVVVGASLLAERPPVAALLMLCGAVCLILLVRRETPKAAPLIPLDLLRGRSFRLSVIASVFCFAGTAAGMIMLPFYLQRGLGQSPAATGAILMAWPLSVAVTALATARLRRAVPTAWLCAIGGAGLALGLAGAAAWPLAGDVRPLLPFIVVCGVGFGLFQSPNNQNMFLSAPLERSAAAGGMQGAARLSGQTAGAVLATLLFSLTPAAMAPRIGLATGAALALTAGLVSLSRGSKP